MGYLSPLREELDWSLSILDGAFELMLSYTRIVIALPLLSSSIIRFGVLVMGLFFYSCFLLFPCFSPESAGIIFGMTPLVSKEDEESLFPV